MVLIIDLLFFPWHKVDFGPLAGDFQQVGPVFAGMARPTEPYEARDMTVTDTDALLRAAGLADDELAKLHESGVIA